MRISDWSSDVCSSDLDWTGYFDASSPGTAVSTAAEAGGVAASTGAAAGACVTAAETSGSAATGSSLSALTAISHTTPTNAAHDPNVQFANLLIIFLAHPDCE